MIATAVCVALGMGIYRMKWNIFEEMIKKTVGDAGVSILILLLIAALLFFLGMFMETLATIVVLAPVFLPIIKSVGIDPVFFGVFWVITNEIALLTPPLGVNLFIAMNLSNLPLERVAKGACPYIFLLILVVFFLIFFPDVVTFLPKALGMY